MFSIEWLAGFFDGEDVASAEVDWGFTLMLGPIALTITKE